MCNNGTLCLQVNVLNIMCNTLLGVLISCVLRKRYCYRYSSFCCCPFTIELILLPIGDSNKFNSFWVWRKNKQNIYKWMQHMYYIIFEGTLLGVPHISPRAVSAGFVTSLKCDKKLALLLDILTMNDFYATCVLLVYHVLSYMAKRSAGIVKYHYIFFMFLIQ